MLRRARARQGRSDLVRPDFSCDCLLPLSVEELRWRLIRADEPWGRSGSRQVVLAWGAGRPGPIPSFFTRSFRSESSCVCVGYGQYLSGCARRLGRGAGKKGQEEGAACSCLKSDDLQCLERAEGKLGAREREGWGWESRGAGERAGEGRQKMNQPGDGENKRRAVGVV